MNPENEKQEHLIAALGHAAVLIPFIGLGVPLITWAARRTESPRLGFQALQALIYQGVGAAGYILYFIFSTALGLASIPVTFGLTAAIENESVSGLGQGEFMMVLFILFMGALMLLGLTVQCVLWPAYLVLGLWAAYRTLQGREFRYPILGAILSRRMAREPSPLPVVSG